MVESVKSIAKRLADSRRVWHSVEFFPPKTSEKIDRLLNTTVPNLADSVDFCSVTYGAGGFGNNQDTLDIVRQIQDEHGLSAVMHLTNTNADVDGIRNLVERARSQNVVNFLALKGDRPDSVDPRITYAEDLLKLIKETNPDACVGVAGFPTGNSAYRESPETNWRFLCRKIESGADFVVTQLFFDNNDFWKMRDFVSKELGRHVPIAAGILPIASAKQIEKFCRLIGVEAPAVIRNKVERYANDPQSFADFGREYTTSQVQSLIDEGGIGGLHFYCLNSSELTTRILSDLRPN